MSRSRYYEWPTSPKTEREKEEEHLLELLKTLFQNGRGTYGTRCLKKKFATLGIVVSRRRIGRLMTQAGLTCKTKKKFKATTNSTHTQPIAPNLLVRQFTVSQPDRSYQQIIYIATQEKKVGYFGGCQLTCFPEKLLAG